MIRFLFTMILFCVPLAGFTQLNDISKKIDRLNHKAYDLKDSDPSEAKRINLKAFWLLNQPFIDEIVQSDVYSVAGTLCSQKSDFKSALNYFIRSLKIRENAGDADKIAVMHKNIANLYYHINNSEKAIDYYKKGLAYRAPSTRSDIHTLAFYNGLTQVFESMQEADSAMYYYIKALTIVKTIKDRNHQFVSDLYSNIGQFYETNGKYGQALAYFNKTLDIQKELEDFYGMAWTYHHMGIVNDYQMNASQAKHYYQLADTLSAEQSDLETQRDIAKSWMLLYTREKNTDSVNYYLDRFEALNDSINKKITDKQLYEAEVKYHTEKTKINLKNAEAQTATLGWFLGTGLFLAFIIFFYLIRTYRQKQRITNMEINLKNREINDLLVQQESSSYAAMLEGQDHERQRIARDLHDRLGSTLAAIRIGLEGAAAGEQSHNKQLVEIAMTEVRSIAHDLSAGNIENYGLNTALEELSYSIGKSGTITMNLYLDEKAVLNNQMKIELYRIVQELISNTLKHANATEITIQTHWHDSHFNLIYEDNGTGFDRSKHTAGMGHRNIAARLEKLEGSFEIDTQLNRGTIVIIDVPQKNEA